MRRAKRAKSSSTVALGCVWQRSCARACSSRGIGTGIGIGIADGSWSMTGLLSRLQDEDEIMRWQRESQGEKRAKVKKVEFGTKQKHQKSVSCFSFFRPFALGRLLFSSGSSSDSGSGSGATDLTGPFFPGANSSAKENEIKQKELFWVRAWLTPTRKQQPQRKHGERA